jgi:hypothetical protein
MNPTVEMICPCHGTHPFGSGVDQPRKISSKDNANSARAAAHSVQASQAAVRAPIPPMRCPRPCCLDPSVTTPLYRTTVSRALRQPLRSGGETRFRGFIYLAVRGEGEHERVSARPAPPQPQAPLPVWRRSSGMRWEIGKIHRGFIVVCSHVSKWPQPTQEGGA